jgi:hypothetical protein
MNNVETDRRYKEWPRDFSSLLTPGWPNEVKIIAKNVYVALAVVDPASRAGLALVGDNLAQLSHLLTSAICSYHIYEVS